MGIPKFFGWLNSRDNEVFRGVVGKSLPRHVNIYAIDMNALVHESINKQEEAYKKRKRARPLTPAQLAMKRHEVFKDVLDTVIDLTVLVKPIDSLILAFDGVAPQAKINQQRNRRYKAAMESYYSKTKTLFDRNEITPGTEFMRDLDDYLREEIESMREDDKRFPPNVFYSSHLTRGEGEHKIADRLRGLNGRRKTVVVHGMDADLIMIYLLLLEDGWNNIVLFRENTRQNTVKSTIDLRKMEARVRALYPDATDPIGDFVVLLFLIGNDFLPHFAMFELIDDAINTLVYGYREYLQQTGSSGLTELTNINWAEMGEFFSYITTRYGDSLLETWATSSRISCPSALAQTCVSTKQIVRPGRTSQQVSFDIESFRNAWYPTIYNAVQAPSREEAAQCACGKTPASWSPVTQNDIDRLVESYLEGITWTYRYYRLGLSAINVNWYYQSLYAPLFSDLATYIQKHPIATWELAPVEPTEYVTPLEQLAMVMPPLSLDVVPEELHSLYDDESPIIDLIPTTFKIDGNGKMAEWQSFAVLPIPEPARVVAAIESLNMPQDVTDEYAEEEPVLLRDLNRF